MKKFIFIFTVFLFTACTFNVKDSSNKKFNPPKSMYDNYELSGSVWGLVGYLDSLCFANTSTVYERWTSNETNKTSALFFKYEYNEPILKMYNISNESVLVRICVINNDTMDVFNLNNELYGRFIRLPQISFTPTND